MTGKICDVCDGDLSAALAGTMLRAYTMEAGIEVVVNCPGCGTEYRGLVRWGDLDLQDVDGE
jgi:hypothetical protein